MTGYSASEAEIVEAKQIDANRSHLPDAAARGGVADNDGGWKNICPELVLARISSLPHTDDFKGADIGKRISIKSVKYGRYLNLLVPPSHLREGLVYILAEWFEGEIEGKDIFRCRFLGYATYEQVKEAPLWDFNHPERNARAHFVRRDLLTPCPETEKEWADLDDPEGGSTCENS